MGTCPKCSTNIVAANVEAITLYEPGGATMNGVKYSCVVCGQILSVGIDPIFQKNRIVLDVVAEMRKIP